MTIETPEADPHNYHDEYWRCGRADECGLVAGWGTDHTGVGACKLHGGATPTGEDNPAFEHGLFSDYLSEEDRRAVSAIDEMGDGEKLDELINWRLARLRRAVRSLNEDEERTFWEAFRQLVQQTGEPDPDQIKELAGMLAQGNRAMQDEIDLVRKLIKERNKIVEGEDHNLAWREALAGTNS